MALLSRVLPERSRTITRACATRIPVAGELHSRYRNPSAGKKSGRNSREDVTQTGVGMDGAGAAFDFAFLSGGARPKAAVRSVGAKGMGLCALEPIASGEIVCASRALLLTEAERAELLKTSLWSHMFCGPLCDGAGGGVIFGDVTFCNHDASPNARLDWRREGERFATVELIALHAIEAGDEISIRYRDVEEYHARGVALR
jgi:hypothetical protein